MQRWIGVHARLTRASSSSATTMRCCWCEAATAKRALHHPGAAPCKATRLLHRFSRRPTIVSMKGPPVNLPALLMKLP
jgi:hypothetical protein